MKFDTLIVGGGLAGLTCGIRLQKNGVKCAIISTGQSALHFSSGSFDLLNELADGTKVDNPLAAAGRVGTNHPYAKLDGKFAYYVREAKQLFLDCGIEVNGDAERNHLRITPMGTLKPTWLTFSDFTQLSSPRDIAGKKVLVVNIAGFLDFNTKFVADSFEKCGAECRISSINLPELERLRISPTEMRSTNIAMVLDGLIDTLNININKGFSVQLGDFGCFRPGINAKSQDREEDVKSDTVYRRKIIFTPGQYFREMLTRASVTRASWEKTETVSGGGSAPGTGGNGEEENPLG